MDVENVGVGAGGKAGSAGQQQMSGPNPPVLLGCDEAVQIGCEAAQLYNKADNHEWDVNKNQVLAKGQENKDKLSPVILYRPADPKFPIYLLPSPWGLGEEALRRKGPPECRAYICGRGRVLELRPIWHDQSTPQGAAGGGGGCQGHPWMAEGQQPQANHRCTSGGGPGPGYPHNALQGQDPEAACQPTVQSVW